MYFKFSQQSCVKDFQSLIASFYFLNLLLAIFMLPHSNNGREKACSLWYLRNTSNRMVPAHPAERLLLTFH